MVNFGIRLHDMRPGTLATRARLAREQGFGCAHLALSKTVGPEENSVRNAALTPGYASHLRKIFAGQDVDIAVLGCYKNLACPDQKRLSAIQQDYLAHLRFAQQLGCSVVGTETGAPNLEYRYEPACHTEEALQSFLRGLAPVLDAAESLGVLLAIEPVWNHIVWNPKVARRVLDEAASPNLRIIFDPVNLLSLENYERRDEVIAEAMELLGEDIAVVHLKDFRVSEKGLEATAAGTGLMDYHAIMRYLKAEKPYIQATLENTVPDNAVQAREYLEKIYNEA